MSTELVRPEFGSADQRGRVTEIKDGPYSRRVVRDRAGRVIAIEGKSRVDDLADLSDDMAERLLHLEGWVEVADTNLLVNAQQVGQAANRLGVVRWPLRVRFHYPDDKRDVRDGWYSCSDEGHVVHVYTDLSADRAAQVILHEAAHASQVEMMGGDEFVTAYQHGCKDEVEAEAIALAETIADLEIVRVRD